MSACEECGSEASPVILDHSFDHAFGTEVILEAACPDCEAPADCSVQDIKDEEAERRAERRYESARDRALEGLL